MSFRPVALALLLGCLLPAWGCARSGPPDIVLILVDTLRRDRISPYGYDIETPTLQRLADEGQVFTNVQANYHQTTMSMGALFTGRTPSIETGGPKKTLHWEGRTWCGMARFAADENDTCVPQDLTTLAESLSEAGYWTAGVVSNRLLFEPAGYEQGFDVWVEVGGDPAARSAPEVNAELEQVLAERPSGPAFVYVHFLDVHDHHRLPAGPGSYDESIRRFDRQLAKTIGLLEEAGLRENAVLFVLSDHGENLGETHQGTQYFSHKGNPSYQALLDIPLIVTPPVFEDPDRFLRSRDVTNLIRQAAGLTGELADESDVIHPDELFLSERNFVTYRRGRDKIMFHRLDPSRYQLYDLELDPGEQNNLVDQERGKVYKYLGRGRELLIALRVKKKRSPGRLTDEDRSRLRALGYLEDAEAPNPPADPAPDPVP